MVTGKGFPGHGTQKGFRNTSLVISINRKLQGKRPVLVFDFIVYSKPKIIASKLKKTQSLKCYDFRAGPIP